MGGASSAEGRPAPSPHHGSRPTRGGRGRRRAEAYFLGSGQVLMPRMLPAHGRAPRRGGEAGIGYTRRPGGWMEPCRHHVFFCRQQKPAGLTCCAPRGAAEALAALQREIAAQRLDDGVQVTPCDSLGMCGRGPSMIVYPEGIWYSGVTAENAVEIVREHLRDGRPVERLVERDMAKLKAEYLHHRARTREAPAAAGVAAAPGASGTTPAR